ncbi:MAG: hypothetical protein V5A25_05120 [Halovenus sp.]
MSSRWSPVLSPKQCAVLAALLVVVTAGCLGFGGSGDDGPGTEMPDVTVEDVSNATAEELATVETFQADVTATNRLVGNVERTSSLEATVRVDRAREAAVFEQTVQAQGRTTEADVYLVNGTIYERSDLYAQQFGSEWIRNDDPDAFEAQWRNNDFAGEIRAYIDHGTAELNGTVTVEGTETRVLELDGNETALSTAYYADPSAVAYRTLEMTVWVDTETYRPVQVAGTVVTEVELQGQTIESTQEYEYTLEYTTVNVTLPDGAADAVDVEDVGPS